MATARFSPLAGVHVLELSGRVAGGYAGRLLVQLGAEVLRVELDRVVNIAPPAREAYLDELDRGKTSARAEHLKDVDLAGIDLVIDDCIGDPAVPGSARSTAARARAVLGDVPVVEISDFGLDGPWADWPGSNLTSTAWASMTWATGAPGRTPLSLPGDLAEYVVGAHAAAAGVLLLLSQGRRAAVAAADVLGYITAMIVNNFIPYGRPWHRDGARATQSGGCYPGAIFESADGPIMIMCRQQSEWDALRAAMGNPAWSQDPRFADPREVARLWADEADLHVKPWAAGLTRAEIVATGRRYGFPVGPVRRVDEALDDEQFAHRGFFETRRRADGRELRVPGVPWITEVATGRGPTAPHPGAAAQRPLAGVRVLDLSWVWSGPMVTSILGDLGAEIVKVEHPSHPDPARARGPKRVGGEAVGGPPLELSPYFNQLGHGKKSIAVDIRHPEGRELVLRLVRDSDIVVENMRPGALERARLDIEHLRAANPTVQLLSMSTMGQTGPASRIMGYGMVMSGLAGLESLVGYDDETMGMFNLAISDPIAGSHALAALLAALYRSRHTGDSTAIDLSQTECTVASILGPVIEAQVLGEAPAVQNTHAELGPHGIYRCRGEDDWVAIAVRTAEERSAAAATVSDHRSVAPGPTELEEDLAAWCAGLDALEAADQARRWGAAAAPVMSFEQLDAIQWYERRGFGWQTKHPYQGEHRLVTVPWELEGRFPQVAATSPLLGEHTTEILEDRLGLSRAEIEALVEAGAVVAPGERPVTVGVATGDATKDTTIDASGEEDR